MKYKKIIKFSLFSILILLFLFLGFKQINDSVNNKTEFSGKFFTKENKPAEPAEDNKNEITKNKDIEEEMINEEIKLFFFGDLMLDRHVAEKIKKYGLDYLLVKIQEQKLTENYDFVMANLEGAVTNEGAHYKPDNSYDFAFNPTIISELKKYNFNIFTLSNNHLSDQGEQGIKETYQNLSELGFNYFGCKDAYLSSSENFPLVYKANENEKQKILDSDDCSLIIVENKNKKIAFFSFSMVYNDIEQEQIIKKIKLAKEKSDFLIVAPHWGIEYQEKANRKQENLAHLIIDSGADLIIGHHPHVLQNYETYKGSPIYYSLGNFIFDQYFSKETQKGLAVSIIINQNNEINRTTYEITTIGSKIDKITKIE